MKEVIFTEIIFYKILPRLLFLVMVEHNVLQTPIHNITQALTGLIKNIHITYVYPHSSLGLSFNLFLSVCVDE